MSEATLWTYVRERLLPPDVHVTRIENGVSAGFPDVHYTYKGRSGTMELKFLRKKNPPFNLDGLNRDQIQWIKNEVEARGKVWIVADIGDQICWIRGKHCQGFNSWTRDAFTVNSSVIFHKRRSIEEAKRNLEVFL